MKYNYPILFILTFFCTTSFCQESYLDASLSSEKRVKLLLREMTLEEKIGQMCQYVGETPKNASSNADERVDYILGLKDRADLIRQGKTGSFLKVPDYKKANYLQELAEESRLKIPLLIATDAIHGHGMYDGVTTIYPTEIGVAASFDPDIAFKMAEYTAVEMRATGYHWNFSPNIELVRDARWGRTGESFGEDPLLISKMGVAMVKGYQGEEFNESDNVLSCAKHFAGGGIPFNGLNGAPADISERTLFEMIFPPFKDAVESGAYTIMPAHNDLNGIPCHAHKEYLTELIRGEWNFQGIFVSDWMDIARLASVHKIARDEKEADGIAVNAGLDVHMQGLNFFENVKQLVNEGVISMNRIDDAVSKILYAKFQLGLFENRYVKESRVEQTLMKKEHLDLALISARKSIVLLKNENQTLPLSKTTNRILMTGPNANVKAPLLGDWTRPRSDRKVATVLESIERLADSKTKITHVPCDSHDSVSAETLSKIGEFMTTADVGILVMGENSNRFTWDERTSGENLDKVRLIPGNQIDLAMRMKKANKPLIVVLINGTPIGSTWLAEHADAIIEAWEPGMFGGQAIAEVIFGDYNPAGRLPITFPRSVGHIQSFYNYKPSAFHRGRPYGSSSAPLYPFGHGLSYTEFKYSDLKIDEEIRSSDDVAIAFNIKNIGDLDGDEVILVYLNDVISSVTTPVKKLVHFKRIHLKKGEMKTVEVVLSNEVLKLYNKDMKLTVEPGLFEVNIADQLRAEFLVD